MNDHSVKKRFIFYMNVSGQLINDGCIIYLIIYLFNDPNDFKLFSHANVYIHDRKDSWATGHSRTENRRRNRKREKRHFANTYGHKMDTVCPFHSNKWTIALFQASGEGTIIALLSLTWPCVLEKKNRNAFQWERKSHTKGQELFISRSHYTFSRWHLCEKHKSWTKEEGLMKCTWKINFEIYQMTKQFLQANQVDLRVMNESW